MTGSFPRVEADLVLMWRRIYVRIQVLCGDILLLLLLLRHIVVLILLVLFDLGRCLFLTACIEAFPLVRVIVATDVLGSLGHMRWEGLRHLADLLRLLCDSIAVAVFLFTTSNLRLTLLINIIIIDGLTARILLIEYGVGL